MGGVALDRPLVIEGSGALSRANRAAADLGVWIADADVERCRHRALVVRGDGDLYEPYWDIWADQERTFFECELPDLVADIVVSGFAL